MNIRNQTSTTNAVLALADGEIFTGIGFGDLTQELAGEVVFNTAITGYQEIITDPSYYQQIVVFTAPHIGNTGINCEDNESQNVHCSGIALHQLSSIVSNWRTKKSLEGFLLENNKIGIYGIDTRKLTTILRQKGSQGGAICSSTSSNKKTLEDLSYHALELAKKFGSMQGKALAYEVSTKKSYEWNNCSINWDGTEKNNTSETDVKKKVCVIDFGVKTNILRRLVDLGGEVMVFPAKTSVEEIMQYNPDGILLSNGPGDPEPCIETIRNVRELLKLKIPMMGICLGHQILAIACGARCKKMKFGHHGANHPVLDLHTKQVMITSQNHGFTVDDENLPNDITTTHRSLFDNTIQGFEHKKLPIFGFQGHPEASPGPQDIDILFNKFFNLILDKTKHKELTM